MEFEMRFSFNKIIWKVVRTNANYFVRASFFLNFCSIMIVSLGGIGLVFCTAIAITGANMEWYS